MEPAEAGERVELIGVFFARELHRLHRALLGEREIGLLREGLHREQAPGDLVERLRVVEFFVGDLLELGVEFRGVAAGQADLGSDGIAELLAFLLRQHAGGGGQGFLGGVPVAGAHRLGERVELRLGGGHLRVVRRGAGGDRGLAEAALRDLLGDRRGGGERRAREDIAEHLGRELSRVAGPGDLAFGDHERVRDAVHLGGFEPVLDEGLAAEGHGIGHLVALGLEEILGALGGGRVAFAFPDVDAGDDDALLAHLLVQLVEVRDRGDARAAPARPAFEDVDLALLEVFHRLALEHRLRPRGRGGITDFETGGGQGGREQQQEQGAHGDYRR